MRRTYLRTNAMHHRYENAKRDPNFIQNAPSVMVFDYWRVIPNQFYYDNLPLTVHHMLVPKRKFAHIDNMDIHEKREFEWLEREVLGEYYDFWGKNFTRRQSIPDWLHFHLVIWKEKPEPNVSDEVIGEPLKVHTSDSTCTSCEG